VTTSGNGILLNLISKHPQHSHIWDNVNQATLHKDIWIASTFNDLVMDTPTLDSITTTLAHAFCTPTKVRKFDHTSFVLHNLSKYVFQHLLPLWALQMSQYHDGIPSDHISRWHMLLNILQASSIWSNISHTSESSYSPQRHQTYNYFEWSSIHEHANHFSSHSASCVFLCLKPRYLSFAYNQKSKREQQDTHQQELWLHWQDWSSVTLFDLWSLEGHGYVANKKLDNIMTKCFSSSTEMGWAKY
jgi:hypothetical protein